MDSPVLAPDGALPLPAEGTIVLTIAGDSTPQEGEPQSISYTLMMDNWTAVIEDISATAQANTTVSDISYQDSSLPPNIESAPSHSIAINTISEPSSPNVAHSLPHASTSVSIQTETLFANDLISDEEEARLEVLRLSEKFGLNVHLGAVAPQLPSASARDKPLKFLTLTWDVRKIIIECLLCNSDLEKCTSVCSEDDLGARVAYGLSPALLRVCRQLYDEGCSVLYGQHDFYIACLPWQDKQLSPLTRFKVDDLWKTPLRELPAVKKIKRWNIVVSVYNARGIS